MNEQKLTKLEEYTSLITLDQAKDLLATCQTLEDLKAIRDEAAARAAYAEAKEMCAEIHNSCWLIKQLAEQKISKLLSAAERGNAGRPKIGNTVYQFLIMMLNSMRRE